MMSLIIESFIIELKKKFQNHKNFEEVLRKFLFLREKKLLKPYLSDVLSFDNFQEWEANVNKNMGDRNKKYEVRDAIKNFGKSIIWRDDAKYFIFSPLSFETLKEYSKILKNDCHICIAYSRHHWETEVEKDLEQPVIVINFSNTWEKDRVYDYIFFMVHKNGNFTAYNMDDYVMPKNLLKDLGYSDLIEYAKFSNEWLDELKKTEPSKYPSLAMKDILYSIGESKDSKFYRTISYFMRR